MPAVERWARGRKIETEQPTDMDIAVSQQDQDHASTKRRRSVRTKRVAGQIQQLPWREVVNPFAALNIISADEIEQIHRSSLKILRDVGMRVLDDDARRYYRAAGAEVNESSHMVRFDPSLVEEMVAKAPSSVRLRARNPERQVTLGGNHMIFSSVQCPAFANDLDKGRRFGTMDELNDFVRIVQSLNIIHQGGGGGFEPVDLPVETRHLDMTYAFCRLTDKTWNAWGNGRDRVIDAVNMACIALQCSHDDLLTQPGITTGINTNSPLQLDIPMAEGIIEMAKAGQPSVITPFTLAGAMAPATEVGALVVQNAEALAGIVLAQAVRPGAPVVYGAFTTNVEMASGSPAFGTPLYAKCTMASGQLARRYGVPFRTSNNNAANSVDAQAAYESQMCLWSSLLSHSNLIFAAAGWLESGLSGSFEKLIVDAEMLQMVAETLTPLDCSAELLGLDAIAEVGPGGHFFGSEHTLERYETTFYRPLLSERKTYESWLEGGSRDAAQRANAIWKQLVAEFEPPSIDPGVDEALQSYVAKRKEAAAKGQPAEPLSA